MSPPVACPRRNDKKSRHRDEAVTTSFTLAAETKYFTAAPQRD
jgi:hypothetical protein